MQDIGFVFKLLDAGYWILDAGHWSLVTGHCLTLVISHKFLVFLMSILPITDAIFFPMTDDIFPPMTDDQ